MKSLSLVIVFISLNIFADTAIEPVKYMSLTYGPSCILEAVSSRLEVVMKSEIALPELFPFSLTTFEQFKNANQSSFPDGFELTAFINLYSLKNNAVYINDAFPNVGENGRTPDEVLAHELTHYIQAKYFNYNEEDARSDAAEDAAVGVQNWFRTNYMDKKSDMSPCPSAAAQKKEYSKEWKW